MKKQKRQRPISTISNFGKISRMGILTLLTLLSLTACSLPTSLTGNGGKQDSQGNSGSGDSSATKLADTGFILTGPDSYDSADTPVIVGINEDDNTVTFLNLELGRKYTLSMDGTTKLYDKYGESISIGQIKEGDIVDVKFLKSGKHLTTMQLSSAAWSYSNVERYEMNTVKGEVTIGEEVYKLGDNIQYFSEGRAIDGMDLNASDTLTFQGIDKEILSISVEKGHGYLRLANDENFIGGWIEIGQNIIKQITEDMLLTVPEGSYQVNISYKGSGGTKSVVINRNEETTLDIGDLKIEEPKYGNILFSVTPSTAKIYIDGAIVDASQPVSLQYGIHQLIAKADGYQSITRYLRVGEESAGIDVVLDSIETDSDDENGSSASDESAGSSESTDSSSSQSNSASNSTSNGNTTSGDASSGVDAVTSYDKVYIDAPLGVEVYLDDNYVGITPCSFRKEEGTHVITLRSDGYETRSYTIYISDEEKDFSYSFADLEAVQ